ncbi:hypothetical protein BGZ73_003885 [Actinomortierella ambigua]|nr:hypothetical protein BGZ73_003885 [Actinomortierella ambigua]
MEKFKFQKDRPNWRNTSQWRKGELMLGVTCGSNNANVEKLFYRQGITTENATDSGRRSGFIEGQKMGLREEDACIKDRWVQGTGEMQSDYLSNVPINWAMAMAGFKDRPFHLTRNEVKPSEDLQR